MTAPALAAGSIDPFTGGPSQNVRSVTIDVDMSGDKPLQLTYPLYYITRDDQIPAVVAWARTLRAVGLDLETSAVKPRKGNIATLQLGHPLCDDPRAYVIDVRCVSRAAMRPIFDLLEDPSIEKVGQNLKFECTWLLHHYGVKVRNCRDTQVTELILRAGLFDAKNEYQSGGERAAYKWCSMAKLTERYLKLDIDKDHDLRTSFYSTPAGEHSERQLKYAAGDVLYVFYIASKQHKLAKQRQLTPTLKIEYETIPILADAEVTGLYMDQLKWRGLWQESIKLAYETERALDEMFRPITFQGDLFLAQDPTIRPIYPRNNKPINYNSPEQKLWAIRAYCESINWPVEVVTSLPEIIALKKQYGAEWMDWQRKKGRKREWADVPDYLIPEAMYCLLPDCDKNRLKLAMLRKQLPERLVTLLLDFSKYEKRASGFGNEYLNKYVDDDGFLRTEFHQCATATGRISTTPNTQNIPGDARFRSCFIAPPGYKLVILDYSQIEPRLSAQVSNDPTYMAAFNSYDDIYLVVATEMFGYRPDKSTPDGAIARQIAKIIVLALAYRMGPVKLRDSLTLGLEKEILLGARPAPTLDEARELWNKFFEACSGVKEFQEQCSTLANPENSPRPKLWDDFLEQYVTYIQAPCGRIRFFPPDALNTYTEAPNCPIQGSSATITKAASVMVQREIDARGWDAHVVNLVHDEIVWMVREDIAHEFKHVAKELMEAAGKFYCPDVPILAEFPENSTGVLDFWAKKLPKPAAPEQLAA